MSTDTTGERVTSAITSPNWPDPLQLADFPGEQAAPEAMLSWAGAEFPGRAAVSCSFGGVGGMVLAHMLSRWAPAIPLLFIDTQFLFPETYALRRLLAEEYGLTILDIYPDLDADQQCTAYGECLWQKDPDLCCHLRKVLPMEKALAAFSAWITSLRRDQSPTRAQVKVLEIHETSSGRRIVKLNPLAYWTKAQVWEYIAMYRVPYNALLDAGYKSIGCRHCTRPGDERDGRWAGRAKTECGLHTFTNIIQ